MLSKLIKKKNIVYIHSPHLDQSSYTFSLTHSPEVLVTKESHMLHTKHKKSCQSMSFYINKRKLTFHLSKSRIRYHRKQWNEGQRAKVKREHRRLLRRLLENSVKLRNLTNTVKHRVFFESDRCPQKPSIYMQY